MKYYIATSLMRMEAHNNVRNDLKKLGHDITYDWTLHGSVKETTKERLREVAISQFEGIESADFLLVLLPGRSGTHTELGYAIASKKKIFIHSEDPLLFELGTQTIAFYHHPDVTCLACPLDEIATKIDSILSCSTAS